MFVPWSADHIHRHWRELGELIKNSCLPGDPESALDCPSLVASHASLSQTSGCKICALVYSLATADRRHESGDLAFYEDYSLLCFYASSAPRCWTSTLAIAAAFLELISLHFPNYVREGSILQRSEINGVDILLHFFIIKCFVPIGTDKLLLSENLNFLKLEFLRGCLVGSTSNLICFKTIWSQMQGVTGKGDTQKPVKAEARPGKTVASVVDLTFPRKGTDTRSNLLPHFLSLWKDFELDVTLPPAENVVCDLEYPQWIDRCQGPCLMAPCLSLKTKNNTRSVCVLCECLAAHPDAQDALEMLKNEIVMSVENNVKIIDRVSFLLSGETALPYVSDHLLRFVIKTRSPQEIHKHLFCDPLCAINAKATLPRILFSRPEVAYFAQFKSLLATGYLPPKFEFVNYDSIETLVLIFKSIQICKVSKTNLLEIIKELDLTLKKQNLLTVHPFQTFQLYT